MDLSKLSLKKANKKPKRLGRGTGSTTGKTAGRGHKGAGQRAGKKSPYAGHAGDNVPYARKLPKRGFKSMRKTKYQLVNLYDLQLNATDVQEINPEVLLKLRLIKNAKLPIKILASIKDKYTVKVLVKADRFSEKARQIIEGAGGKVECLTR
jgi:large subunit ribosomal protein L15